MILHHPGRVYTWQPADAPGARRPWWPGCACRTCRALRARHPRRPLRPGSPLQTKTVVEFSSVPLWFWSRPNSMLDPPAWHWLPGLTAVTWTAARGIFRLASTHVPVSRDRRSIWTRSNCTAPARPDSAHSSADPTWAGGTVSHAGYLAKSQSAYRGQSTPPRRPAAPIPRLPAHCDFDCGHEFSSS